METVTTLPARRHQRAVLELAAALRDACPDDLEVLIAPFAVALADDTELQPDVLVARLSDLSLKKARFEAAGTPAYWVVDPLEPRQTSRSRPPSRSR